MWPWGHLAVGYLAFSLLAERRSHGPPTDRSVIVLAAMTQFPDVVDKTLAWNLGILPNGRSLAHSALVATVVIAVVGLYLQKQEHHELALAVGVGYASHLLADAFQPFVTGQWADLVFLGWPLLPAPSPTGAQSVLERFVILFDGLAAGDISVFFAIEIGLVLFAVVRWATQGYPGLGFLRRDRPDRRVSSD